jgi:hypothetical protein
VRRRTTRLYAGLSPNSIRSAVGRAPALGVYPGVPAQPSGRPPRTTGRSAEVSARHACIARRMRASASIRATRPTIVRRGSERRLGGDARFCTGATFLPRSPRVQPMGKQASARSSLIPALKHGFADRVRVRRLAPPTSQRDQAAGRREAERDDQASLEAPVIARADRANRRADPSCGRRPTRSRGGALPMLNDESARSAARPYSSSALRSACLPGQCDVHPGLPVPIFALQLPVPGDDVAVVAEPAREPGRLALHPPGEALAFLGQARLVRG